jgi:hypothetical protein
MSGVPVIPQAPTPCRRRPTESFSVRPYDLMLNAMGGQARIDGVLCRGHVDRPASSEHPEGRARGIA